MLKKGYTWAKDKALRAYCWCKKKLLWFFLGGVALAAGVEMLTPEQLGGVAEYARIENGEVKYVVLADEAWINSAGGVESGLWMEVRNDNASTKDDADIGDTYDVISGGFISAKPSEDATLDAEKGEWVVPAKSPKHPPEFYVASSTDL